MGEGCNLVEPFAEPGETSMGEDPRGEGRDWGVTAHEGGKIHVGTMI
jgi:hypothetical protein